MEKIKSNFKKIILSFMLIIVGFAFAIGFSACINPNQTKNEEQATKNFEKAYVQLNYVEDATFSDDCEDIYISAHPTQFYVDTMKYMMKLVYFAQLEFDKVVYVDEERAEEILEYTPEYRYKISITQQTINILSVWAESGNTQFWSMNLLFDKDDNITKIDLQLIHEKGVEAQTVSYDFSTNEVTIKDMTQEEVNQFLTDGRTLKWIKKDIILTKEA